MNNEGTNITPTTSTTTAKCDDPNTTIAVKFGDENGSTGRSGSAGPRPARDPFKEINKKYHFKGKYPKPR